MAEKMTMKDDLYNMLNDLMPFVERIERVDFILQTAGLLIWLTGWYIAYQMYRHRFLLLILIGDCLWLLDCVLRLAHPVRASYERGRILDGMVTIVAGDLLSILGTMFSTVGALWALRFLQRKWEQSEANKVPEDTARKLADPQH